MKSEEDKKKVDCEILTQTLLSSMKTDGYSCKNEFYIFRALTNFCKEGYAGTYSADTGAAFLEEKCKLFKSAGHKNVYRIAIARLDQALNGIFHWKPEPVVKPYPSSCFNEVVEGYEAYLKQTKKTKNDIRRHVRLAAKLLAVAELQGVAEINDITPAIVYAAFEKTGAKESFRKIKPFFRYVYKHGLISKDLSEYVPIASRHDPTPSVYSPEEINTALESINRNTAIGKRDYCIFLLAARYGIRTSDIAGLFFENIDLNGNAIHIVQGKTDVPISFPLMDDVSGALADYIKNARPDSASPNVFLSISKPYAMPLSMQGIYRIVSKCLVGSGINIGGRRHGAHALRSSLATHLLSEGVSYPEVQQVLGHTSPGAAIHYIRVEEEKLRECAMDVPVLGKSILSYLEGRSTEL